MLKSLRSALHAGEHIYGTLIVSPSPAWVKAVRDIGLDFVFIDTEHIPLQRDTLAWMCQAYAAVGLPPIVRIPSPDPYQACMVLDGGAQGIIAPYIETPEQVRALVGAVKHKPIKGRTLEGLLQGAPAGEPLCNYLDDANAQHVLIINIESVPALNALDEILAVPGLDGVLIGPHDLTCSLGIPEQWNHPTFIASVVHIITSTRAAGLGVGIHVIFDNSLEQEARWMRMGANLVVHHADILSFRFAMKRDLAALRTAVGQGTQSETTHSINI